MRNNGKGHHACNNRKVRARTATNTGARAAPTTLLLGKVPRFSCSCWFVLFYTEVPVWNCPHIIM